MPPTTIAGDGTDSPIEAIKTSVSDLTEEAKESGSEALDRVKDLVVKYPLQSVGVALAAGYLLKLFTGPLLTVGVAGATAYFGMRARASAGKSSPRPSRKSAAK